MIIKLLKSIARRHALVTIVLGTVLVQAGHAGPAFESDSPAYAPKPWTQKDFQNDPNDFRFLVIGDRTGGERLGIFDRAMDKANLFQPEFVMSIGDLIEGYTSDLPKLDSMWSELDEKVSRLDMPFFRVIGNHDLGNDTMRKVWESRYGPTYYHFKYRDCLFLALNSEDPPNLVDPEFEKDLVKYNRLKVTDPEAAAVMLAEFMKSDRLKSYRKPANFSDDQVEYVRKVLSEDKDARWTFVFFHQPAWENPSENFVKIENLLRENERQYTVFAGHMHYYKHEERFGRDYIRMGTVGGSFHKDGPGNVDHLTWVTMKDGGPVIANIKLDGIFKKDDLKD
ncbi:metallophosphoesterase family protein [Microbulbifer hainanensis]|uniref:metallophosphoesterase family protein n=1 Tax=Microbulbifer hainanensis TaxID=2735675 RepID=UPI001868BBF4|nr:metallophosphoesterase [Microbulbifer hainanensis]